MDLGNEVLAREMVAPVVVHMTSNSLEAAVVAEGEDGKAEVAEDHGSIRTVEAEEIDLPRDSERVLDTNTPADWNIAEDLSMER